MLNHDSEICGVLASYGGGIFEWTAKEQIFLEVFARLSVPAIDSARQYDHCLKQTERLWQMQTHANTVASKQYAQDVIDTAVSLSKSILEAENVTFHQVDEQRGEIWQLENSLIEEAAPYNRLSINGSVLPGCVAKDRKVVVIHDAEKDDRVDKKEEEVECYPTKNVLAVPVIHPHSQALLGIAQFINKTENRVWDDFDVELANMFLSQVAISIEKSESAAEARTQEHQLRRLVTGITALLPLRHREEGIQAGQAIEPSELIETALSVAMALVGGDRASLHLLDNTEQQIWQADSWKQKVGSPFAGVWTEVGSDLVSELLMANDQRLGIDEAHQPTQAPTIITNAYADPRFQASTDECIGGGKYKTASLIMALVRSVALPELNRTEESTVDDPFNMFKTHAWTPMAVVIRIGHGSPAASPDLLVGELLDMFARVTATAIALSQAMFSSKWTRMFARELHEKE